MSIEEEIFKRYIIEFEKLEAFGFKKEKENYLISKYIFNNTLRIDIKITTEGIISGNIYDLEFNDLYTNYRMEEKGEYANLVRGEFENFLREIRDNCTSKKNFVFNQTNRIAYLIEKKYQDKPIFPWTNSLEHGVFKNPNNGKWYALIMYIKRNKIAKGDDYVEVLNIKLAEEKIAKLLLRKGFYRAYHMNKEKWITIILDDTISDEEIMEYIDESYQFTQKKGEWIIPANPKYWDIINCFNDTDTIGWKQPSNILVGDNVYIYVAAPYSAVLYKCEVIEKDIPYKEEEKILLMRLKLKKRYKKEQYNWQYLKEHGIKAVRGIRRIPDNIIN